MGYTPQLLAILSLLLCTWHTQSQLPIDVSIIPIVEFGSNPFSVTLTWNHTAVYGRNYTDAIFIIKRSDNAYNFSSANFVTLDTIPINNFADGNTFSFTDTNVQIGNAYEYKIEAQLSHTNTWQPIEGFVVVGLELPLTDNRGHVILVIESSMGDALVDELQQLKMDLIGDGWEITSVFVNSTDSVVDVRSLIAAAHGTREKSTVFLVGRVPVPYSGNEEPDGHGDHKGAWPADAYYTSIRDDYWTDTLVNNPNAADPRNKNVPGDGKFDQTYIDGSDVQAYPPKHDPPYLLAELEIGRVYLGKYEQIDELTAMKYYFKKNHGYRFREANYTFNNKAIINDDFKWFGGEAMSASVWRTYPHIVGMSNVREGKVVTDLTEDSALVAAAIGYGTYNSILGTGSTTDILNNVIRAAFFQVYGSYLCDWDSNNNILRSPLLGSHGLGSIQSGRPYSFLHMTTTGKHIGFATHMSLAHDYKYFSNFFIFMIHNTLQGDPTLRFFVVAPPSNVQTTPQSGGLSLSWTASPDNIVGYHVYRSTSSVEGPYARITSSPVSDTTFLDADAVDGTNYYLVKAIQLTQTPATSFYNPSQAAFATATYTRPPAAPAAPSSISTPGAPSSNRTPLASSAPIVFVNISFIVLFLLAMAL